MDKTNNQPVKLRPTIFVVEEDNAARPCLIRNLRLFGFRLLVVAEVEDAIEWLGGDTYIHADLLLIDLVGKLPQDALAVGRTLRAQAGYPSETPVVECQKQSLKMWKALTKTQVRTIGSVITKTPISCSDFWFVFFSDLELGSC